MKKKATEFLYPFHMLCPFCGEHCDRTASLTWCSGCYVEWYKSRNGDFVFDTKRKTERFAFAKALCKSGGAKIGGTDEETNRS